MKCYLPPFASEIKRSVWGNKFNAVNRPSGEDVSEFEVDRGKFICTGESVAQNVTRRETLTGSSTRMIRHLNRNVAYQNI
jgi:hypothetical protein